MKESAATQIPTIVRLRCHNKVTIIATTIKIPTGLTVADIEASTDARIHRWVRHATTDDRTINRNNGSEPPSALRWSQAKLITAKYPATHPDQSRHTSSADAREHANEIARSPMEAETPSIDTRAMRYDSPQACFGSTPAQLQWRIALEITRYCALSPYELIEVTYW
jgi:hypothetical protein